MRKNLNNLTDEELFELVKIESNDLAYTVLYERFKKPLLSYTIKKIGSEFAIDIVHDILSKIWTHRETISFEKKFAWYIFHILKNKIIDFVNKSNLSNKYLSSLDIEKIDWSTDDADLKIRQESFWKEIDQHLIDCVPNAKKILLLNLEGYNNHEVANELNISEKTVRNQKSMIIKFLKSKFSIIIILAGQILDYITTR